MSASPSQHEVEAAVRRYLSRLAARYLPVLVGAVALVLVIAFVPSTSETPGNGQSLAAGEALPVSAPSSDPGAGQAPVASDGGTALGPVPEPSGASASRPGSTRTGLPAAVAGVSRAGVRCTGGARQVSWTNYAPPCVPMFTGDNGGATARGVSASTITFSYRVANSADDAAIMAATGSAAPPKDADYIKDLQVYLDYFNSQFELYGRKVVLKPYTGQGDYIDEDQGQGADKAQADAATARGLGAFGDMTFQLRGSNPYWSALAQEKVVAFGPLGFPDSYYEKHAPYWWSVTPSGTDQADWMGNVACRRLAGMKAIFAPDSSLAARDRKFGLVHPDNPEYVLIADRIKGLMKDCGLAAPKEVTYSINVAQFQTQSTNIVAQMQNDNVTTVLCYCDPVIPIFLGNAAQAQRYHPEWLQPYWGDAQGRQPYGGNWQGMMSMGGQWPAKSANEAYVVYRTASGGKEPVEKYYAAAYATLVQIFTALQAAGPNLTPSSMEVGTRRLPDGFGYAGRWTYRGGAHAYTPVDEAPVGWYDPTFTSPFDGEKGGYRFCESGRRFTFADVLSWGAPRRQLHCFGK